MISPTYWCWAPPLGTAAGDPRFIEIIRPKLVNLTFRNGTTTANTVADEIVSRGLGVGQVAVLLQNFGDDLALSEARLWKHPSDGIVGYDDAPFYEAGVAECRVFTREFIGRLQTRLASDGSPNPTAFWMDSEDRLIINSNLYDNWAAIKADPRWSSEVITFDGRTWADLDPPDPNPSFAWNAAENGEWIAAARVGLYEGQSYAMHRAFDQLIEQAFPTVWTGNWITSHDGPYIGGESAGLAFWTGHGTHQCPVLYAPDSDFREWKLGTGDLADRAVLEYAAKVNVGKLSGRPYAPWIQGVGEPEVSGEVAIRYYDAIVKQGIIDGLRHFLVYASDLTPTSPANVAANWTEMVAALDQAELAANAVLDAEEQDITTMSNLAEQTYIKHPDEVRAATMSFRHKLSPGDSLTGTPSVTFSPSGPTTSSVAINTSAVSADYITAGVGEAVQFTITGGTDGVAYRIIVSCGTTAGETLIGLANLTVEDEAT